MDDQKSRCAVERTALVVRREGGWLRIRANGKEVRVAAGKAADGITPGDTVKWDGSKWTLLR